MRIGATTGGLAIAGLGAGLAALRGLAGPRRWRDLTGRVVLVTGGSRGLGLVLAREAASLGASLVLCARDARELETARAELEALGARVLAVPCDVGDRAQARALVDRAIERFGRLDVLVNNAGIIQVAPLENLSREDWDEAMRIIWQGTLDVTLAALPHLLERGDARIVNITSIGGVVSVPHLLPYAAAKAATIALSNGLRAELAGSGVRVVTVVPGLMRTGSFVHALFKGRREAEMTWFSLGAALPPMSMNAGRAARRILRATRRGEAWVTLGTPAKVLRLANALLPGMVADAAGVVARLLPRPDDAGPRQAAEPGWMHRSPLTRSRLMKLGDDAALENNETPVIH